MPLKIVTVDGVEYAEIKDNKPVYVVKDPEGEEEDATKEVVYDGEALYGVVGDRNARHKKDVSRIQELEENIKKFDGIEDPEEALKALDVVSNLDAKKLVDAGQAENVRQEAIKKTEEKYKPLLEETEGKLSSLEKQLHNEIIGNRFASSKFISDKMAVPLRMVQATFKENFVVEDGKVVPKLNGETINSKENLGEAAGFDEAMEILVNTYPDKDMLLKGTGKSGSGAPGSDGSKNDGGKTMKRSEFNRLSLADQNMIMEKGNMDIVD